VDPWNPQAMESNAVRSDEGAVPGAVVMQEKTSGLERIFQNVRSAWLDLAQSKDQQRLRDRIAACIEGRSGEISARRRAIELGRSYLALDSDGRSRFLRMLAEFDVDHASVQSVADRLRAAEDVDVQRSLRRELRETLTAPRTRLLRQFTSLPDGVKFLVDLRADLLQLRGHDPLLRDLEVDLRGLLASWFDVGFLDLRKVTWDAPASFLERLAGYEAVHEMRGWQDLKHRLQGNRRCFAFVHPLMPDEPIIFVEVALLSEIATAIAPLLARTDPGSALDPNDAEVAIFYSISNCQRGLEGISFGNALIKRVVSELSGEFRGLRTFATLSPIPGFRTWLETHAKGSDAPLAAMLAKRSWHRDPAVAEALRGPVMRLCAHYLLDERRSDGRALDPVANFHVSNGARVERIDWLGDLSAKALAESAGLMVNYLYKLDSIDANHEAYAVDRRIVASPAVRALAH